MSSHTSEATLIADQLHRAFYGEAWHGPALMELLEEIDATTAIRSLPGIHSIWELVLHVEVWDDAALRRLAGEKWQPTGIANFPMIPLRPSDAAWRKTMAQAKSTHDRLVKTITALPESRLRDRVPGKKYNFAHLLHGVVQHELYHAGQIAILKKIEPSGD